MSPAVGRTTDAALIRASIEHPEAFVAVFRRHYGTVRAYAGRRVGPDHADEVAAETFTRAFASRRSFRPVHEDACPWLLGIAGNVLHSPGARSGGVSQASAAWHT